MITPFVQYQERFKPGMPSQICKMTCDFFAWEAADPLLLEAMRSGKPIKDWTAFLAAMFAFTETRPDDYVDKMVAEDMRRLGR